MKFFLTLLFLLPLLSTCRWGTGLCPGECTSPAPVSVSGVITRPNPDGTMDVGISGNNFEPGATVTISDVNCADVDVQSPQYLECTLPSQDIPIVDIIITNPSGGSTGGGGSGGSGGSGGGGAAAFHTLFATSTTHGGNLGGLAGADAICQARAAAGSVTSTMTGTWRALLSTDTVDAKDRATFVLGSSIKNTHGDTVLASSSSLWSGGSLLAAIGYDENGALITLKIRVHTGTNADGTKVPDDAGTTQNCDDWTGTGNSLDSYIGNPSSTSSDWIHSSNWDCRNHATSESRLYCINSNN